MSEGKELKKEELSKVEIERKIIDSMLNKFEKTIKDEAQREFLEVYNKSNIDEFVRYMEKLEKELGKN